MSDLAEFKAELEKYMALNRDCNRNTEFRSNYKKNISKTYILVMARHAPGRRHFWWFLDKKIYDSSIQQFTTSVGSDYDPDFSTSSPLLTNVQNAFNKVYSQYNYYDESVASDDINAILVPWYNGLSYAKV